MPATIDPGEDALDDLIRMAESAAGHHRQASTAADAQLSQYEPARNTDAAGRHRRQA